MGSFFRYGSIQDKTLSLVFNNKDLKRLIRNHIYTLDEVIDNDINEVFDIRFDYDFLKEISLHYDMFYFYLKYESHKDIFIKKMSNILHISKKCFDFFLMNDGVFDEWTEENYRVLKIKKLHLNENNYHLNKFKNIIKPVDVDIYSDKLINWLINRVAISGTIIENYFHTWRHFDPYYAFLHGGIGSEYYLNLRNQLSKSYLDLFDLNVFLEYDDQDQDNDDLDHESNNSNTSGSYGYQVYLSVLTDSNEDDIYFFRDKSINLYYVSKSKYDKFYNLSEILRIINKSWKLLNDDEISFNQFIITN